MRRLCTYMPFFSGIRFFVRLSLYVMFCPSGWLPSIPAERSFVARPRVSVRPSFLLPSVAGVCTVIVVRKQQRPQRLRWRRERRSGVPIGGKPVFDETSFCKGNSINIFDKTVGTPYWYTRLLEQTLDPDL